MNRIEILYDLLMKYSHGRKDMLIRAAQKVIDNNISPAVVSDYQAVIEMANNWDMSYNADNDLKNSILNAAIRHGAGSDKILTSFKITWRMVDGVRMVDGLSIRYKLLPIKKKNTKIKK